MNVCDESKIQVYYTTRHIFKKRSIHKQKHKSIYYAHLIMSILRIIHELIVMAIINIRNIHSFERKPWWECPTVEITNQGKSWNIQSISNTNLIRCFYIRTHSVSRIKFISETSNIISMYDCGAGFFDKCKSESRTYLRNWKRQKDPGYVHIAMLNNWIIITHQLILRWYFWPSLRQMQQPCSFHRLN